jgi:O-antigen biosynthesis protein
LSCRSSTIEKYHRHVGESGSESLLGLLGWIPPLVDVLDIGTATGALGEILSRERGCRVDGIELDLSAAAVARPHYRRIVLADLDRSGLREIVPPRSYDVIVLADVLEHLEDPARVLGQTRELLRPGGEVLISIPNVAYAPLVAELLAGRFRYRSTGILDDTHLHFFTRSSLLELIEAAGLAVVELERVQRPLHESEFGTWALEALPDVVRTYLLTRQEAGSYQFLVRCRSRGELGEGVSAPLDDGASPPRLEFSLSLLWRNDGSGYETENRVVTWGELGGGPQLLTLPLPEPTDRPLHGLRIDLANRRGWVELKAMRLLDGDGEPVWTWDGAADSLRSSPREGLVLSPMVPADGGVGLLIGERGGSLELPIPAGRLSALASEARLEVELAWPLSPEHTLIVERLRGELRELTEAEERIRRLEDEVRFLQAQLAERLELLHQVEKQYLEAVRERDRALESR